MAGAFLLAAVLAVLVVGRADAVPLPGDVRPQVHVVRAGASNPVDPASGEKRADPFIYTAYYPHRLQVHRGDLVRWELVGGYGGWHTVTFNGPGFEPEPIVRADEMPGYLAMTDWWLFGHGGPGEDGACGRTDWWEIASDIDPSMAAELEQPPCLLTNDRLDEAHEEISSSLWDRFFAMTDEGCPTCEGDDPDLNAAWVAQVDLEPGTYVYTCKMHPLMEGTIEVLPGKKPLDNPSAHAIAATIAEDHANASAVVERLGDPDRAWDPVEGGWVVNLGASTEDQRVSILQYLPAALPDLRRGDRIRFVAGSQEPNTVTFPGGPTVAGYRPVQGRVSSTSACDTDSCEPDAAFEGNVRHFLPSGAMALQVEWDCEYDEVDGGAPGVPFVWLQPRLAARAGEPYGCPVVNGQRGLPEMYFPEAFSYPNRAPRDQVVTDGSPHTSGWMISTAMPTWYRALKGDDLTLGEFEAEFPSTGRFTFFCTLHEFMSGSVVVR